MYLFIHRLGRGPHHLGAVASGHQVRQRREDGSDQKDVDPEHALLPVMLCIHI